MSKRFGRNQRRRLRQELETAHGATQDAVSSWQKALARAAHAEAEIAYVRDALRFNGIMHSALLPARQIVARDGDPRTPRRVDVCPSSLEVVAPGDDDALNAATLASYQVIDMYSLSVGIDSAPEAAAQHVHFFVDGHGKYAGSWSYQASDRALANGVAPDAVARLGMELARRFSAAFRRDRCHG